MKKSKWIQGLLLGTVGLVTLGAAACDLNDKEPFTGFLPGLGTKVKRTELLVLEEVIDYVEEGTYTITLEKKGEPYTTDLTEKKRWPADEPGEYTITYTVHEGANKGIYTYTFIVPADYVTWDASAEPIDIFYETELQFQDVYDAVNLFVFSYYDYEAFVENIRIGDTVYEMEEGQTSFYVDSLQMHYITFGIRTEDGQVRKSIVQANVIYSDDQTTLYLNELSSGTHTIEVANVQSVEINGEACAAEDVTITAEGVTFDKQTLYEKYAGVNFISLQTPKGEVRDTIFVYTDFVSFEDERAVAPTFLTLHQEWSWKQTIGQMVVTEQFATDGERALRVIANDYYWPMFVLDIEYLDMIFSSDVDELAFDMTYAGTSPEHTYRDLTTLNGLMPTQKLYRNVPTTIRITREIYEKTKAVIAQAAAAPDGDALKKQTPNGLLMLFQNNRDAAGGWDNPPTIYVDNFRAVRNVEGLNLSTGATGWHQIDNTTLESVRFTGGTIPNDKIMATDDGVAIDKSWLSTYVGENSLLFTVAGKTYSQVVRVYPTTYDFEDGVVPAFFSKFSNNFSLNVDEFNGGKALKMASSTDVSDPTIEFSAEYMNWVFSQAGVECLTFDVTANFEQTGEKSTIVVYHDMRVFGSSNYQLFENGVASTFTITKAQYEMWKATSLTTPVYRLPFNTRGYAMTMYIDNLTVHAYQDAYDFEDGYIPAFFTKYSNNFTLSVESVGSGKALAMKSSTNTSNPTLEISAEYMNWAFSQAGVESLSFDVTANFTQTGEKNTIVIYYDMRTFGTNTYQVYENGVASTFTITKAQYEQWKAVGSSTFRLPLNSRNYEMTLYIDNFSINKA